MVVTDESPKSPKTRKVGSAASSRTKQILNEATKSKKASAGMSGNCVPKLSDHNTQSRMSRSKKRKADFSNDSDVSCDEIGEYMFIQSDIEFANLKRRRRKRNKEQKFLELNLSVKQRESKESNIFIVDTSNDVNNSSIIVGSIEHKNLEPVEASSDQKCNQSDMEPNRSPTDSASPIPQVKQMPRNVCDIDMQRLPLRGKRIYSTANCRDTIEIAAPQEKNLKRYCICRRSHITTTMIACDCCKEWCHTECVGISTEQFQQINKSSIEFYCPFCTAMVFSGTICHSDITTTDKLQIQSSKPETAPKRTVASLQPKLPRAVKRPRGRPKKTATTGPATKDADVQPEQTVTSFREHNGARYIESRKVSTNQPEDATPAHKQRASMSNGAVPDGSIGFSQWRQSYPVPINTWRRPTVNPVYALPYQPPIYIEHPPPLYDYNDYNGVGHHYQPHVQLMDVHGYQQPYMPPQQQVSTQQHMTNQQQISTQPQMSPQQHMTNQPQMSPQQQVSAQQHMIKHPRVQHPGEQDAGYYHPKNTLSQVKQENEVKPSNGSHTPAESPYNHLQTQYRQNPLDQEYLALPDPRYNEEVHHAALLEVPALLCVPMPVTDPDSKITMLNSPPGAIRFVQNDQFNQCRYEEGFTRCTNRTTGNFCMWHDSEMSHHTDARMLYLLRSAQEYAAEYLMNAIQRKQPTRTSAIQTVINTVR